MADTPVTKEDTSEKVQQLTQQFATVYRETFAQQQSEMVDKASPENPPSFEQFNQQFGENITQLEQNNPEFKKLNDVLDKLNPDEQKQIIENVQANVQNNYVDALQQKGVDTKEFQSEVEAYNKKQQDLLSTIDPAKLNEFFGEGVGTVIALFMGMIDSLAGNDEEKEVATEKDNQREARAGENKPEQEESQTYEIGEDGMLKPNKPFAEMTDDELAHFKQAESEMLSQQSLEQEELQKQPQARILNAIDGIPGINPESPKIVESEKSQETVGQELGQFHNIAGLEGFTVPSGISMSSENFTLGESVAPQTTAMNFDAVEKASGGRA